MSRTYKAEPNTAEIQNHMYVSKVLLVFL